MKYLYDTAGSVCARSIEVEVENNIIKHVAFNGGCDGNHRGIISLVKGMEVDEVIKRLSGITCGMRPTSCPDQLACALKKIQMENE